MKEPYIENYEYHGVVVEVNKPSGSGGLQYSEVNDLVDAYIKNEKGEFLRKLVIDIDENDDIWLDPTYSARAIDRVKNLRPRQSMPDFPPPPQPTQKEKVAPWPTFEGGLE